MNRTAERLMEEAVELEAAFRAGQLRGHEKEAVIRLDRKTRALELVTGRKYDELAREISRKAEEKHG